MSDDELKVIDRRRGQADAVEEPPNHEEKNPPAEEAQQVPQVVPRCPSCHQPLARIGTHLVTSPNGPPLLLIHCGNPDCVAVISAQPIKLPSAIPPHIKIDPGKLRA